MGTHLGVGYLLRVACACLSVEQLRGLITASVGIAVSVSRSCVRAFSSHSPLCFLVAGAVLVSC